MWMCTSMHWFALDDVKTNYKTADIMYDFILTILCWLLIFVINSLSFSFSFHITSTRKKSIHRMPFIRDAVALIINFTIFYVRDFTRKMAQFGFSNKIETSLSMNLFILFFILFSCKLILSDPRPKLINALLLLLLLLLEVHLFRKSNVCVYKIWIAINKWYAH